MKHYTPKEFMSVACYAPDYTIGDTYVLNVDDIPEVNDITITVPKGDLYRNYVLFGNGHVSITVTGDGDGTAVRDGGGSGNAIRDGGGCGSAYRNGDGDGDAIRTGNGHGGAFRYGCGNGTARIN